MSRRSKHKSHGKWQGNHHAVNTSPPKIAEEQIRQRAYQIFLARGTRPGTAQGDWLQAEKELMARLVHH